MKMITTLSEENTMIETKQKPLVVLPVAPTTRGTLPPLLQPDEFAGMGGSYTQDPETGRITRNED